MSVYIYSEYCMVGPVNTNYVLTTVIGASDDVASRVMCPYFTYLETDKRLGVFN